MPRGWALKTYSNQISRRQVTPPFWVLATKVEALVSLRDPDAEPELAAAVAKAPQPWMAGTLVEQIRKLKALL